MFAMVSPLSLTKCNDEKIKSASDSGFLKVCFAFFFYVLSQGHASPQCCSLLLLCKAPCWNQKKEQVPFIITFG